MAKILSLDASTEACSVALLNDGEITQRYQLAPRQHAKLLLPMVDDLLSGSQLALTQLDAIACHVGPGAFTGIRIAVSVAQGLAYGADLATISLSSLANLAALGFSKNGKKEWLCAIDARMHEVYFASFIINQQQLPIALGDEQVIAPSAVDWDQLKQKIDLRQVGLIGSGWQVYADELFTTRINSGTESVLNGDSYGLDIQQLQPDCLPDAKFGLAQAEAKMARGLLLNAEELQPVYLRNNVALKKSLKK